MHLKRPQGVAGDLILDDIGAEEGPRQLPSRPGGPGALDDTARAEFPADLTQTLRDRLDRFTGGHQVAARQHVPRRVDRDHVGADGTDVDAHVDPAAGRCGAGRRFGHQRVIVILERRQAFAVIFTVVGVPLQPG